LLQGLVELGFAQKDSEKGLYWASLKVWELGQAVLSRLDLGRAAEGPLHALREATRETVHLAVLEGTEVVYVIRLDSPQPIRLSSAVGRRAPAYCVSTGKAILAFTAQAQQEAISRGLVAQTAHTIVDPDKFMQEMAHIRDNGYSVSREEWTLGVWGIGAPILTGNGHVFGAISVTGPMDRIKGSGLKKTANVVVAAAHQIAQNLGAPFGV
jgi:IclR family transcriptional regulator, KDG regulon repressor